MTIEVDPGTARPAGRRRGRRCPSPTPSRTSSPTRSSPRSTATPAPSSSSCSRRPARAWRHNGPKLAAGLKRFEPTARDLAKINGALAERRQNIAPGDHELRPREPGARSARHAARRVRPLLQRRPGVVRAPGGLAPGDRSRSSPATLRETRSALASGNRFALQLGPASRRADPGRPGAGPRAAPDPAAVPQDGRPDPTPDPALRAGRAEAAQAPRSRPSKPLAKTTTGLTKSFRELNLLLQRARLQPARARRRRATCSGSPG